ncbi:MAG TPA: Ig-like domain repeat protein [Nocardioides sp.]|uniref:Ig-like domain repeat protein n=1 Tax=Nocardioides sp. TaxID=35761 RepID=UPI002E30DF19|nr:Ig-like domain repeat protein [Nocardioides sp.]HEX5087287.1 Ig-like domain repeat protein [Nocardioides sp.]
MTKSSRRARRLIGITATLSVGVVAAGALVGITAAPASADFKETRITFTNGSDSALVLESTSIPHGEWNQEPPSRINIGQVVTMSSSNADDSILTGTEWSAIYRLENGSTLRLHYNNPAVGSDDFDEQAPVGYMFEAGGVIENRVVRFRCDSQTCDGIADEWKRNGVTIDPGGGLPPQFVDLPKMGVTIDRPTVMIHMDWMKDAAGNSWKPRQAAIDNVINAFDRAPVTYRGATRPGITLVVDAGPDSTITPNGARWDTLSRATDFTWSQYFLTGNRVDGFQETNFFTRLKNNFVPTGRLPIFHYAVAADVISQDTRPMPPVDDNTSGLAVKGNFGFMLTLGNWSGNTNGSLAEQTGTLMHEFGHVLGFDHSGGEGNGDAVNFKPNHPSVMNYAWQTVGVFQGGVRQWDFLRDDMPNIDETKLTQAGGINLGSASVAYGATNSCGTKDAAGVVSVNTTNTQAALAPMDLDCDGTAGNDAPGATGGYDANGDTVIATLNGPKAEWPRVKFKTGAIGFGARANELTLPSSGLSTPDEGELTLEQAENIRVLPLATKLTYTGALAGDYHDKATVSATLVDATDGDSPVAGKAIAFELGVGDTCSAVTNSAGSASCTITPTQAPGPYPIKASFAGDTVYASAFDASRTFTVTREETTLSLTGPTVILAGSGSTTLSAQLLEGGPADVDGDGSTAPPSPAGQSVTFGLGGQSCTGTVSSTGAVGCSIASVSGAALGPTTLTATFAGDTYYEPSSASADVIVFAFPSRGAFVLGDRSVAAATPTTSLTWWGDSWSTGNSVSAGAAPDAFKGFAASVTSLPTTTPADSCGTTFLTRTGNSPPPTSEVPGYMGVLVASTVVKDKAGSITGVWGKVVVVKTDTGYAPSPGRPGTGKVVATFCG